MLAVARRAFLFLGPGACLLFGQCDLEIATVAGFNGTFVDSSRGHILAKNDVICSDSKIERDKNAKHSSDDFINLKPRQGGPTEPFRCKDLLGCEKPLDLSKLTEAAKKSLSGQSLFESIQEWWNSRGRTTTTISGRRSLSSLKPVLKTMVIEANSPIPAADAFLADAHTADYYLELCPYPTDRECGQTIPIAQKFSWSPGTKANLPVPPPVAGIHLLYRLKDEDPELRTADRALVIAVPWARLASIPEARRKIADAEKVPPPPGVPRDEFEEGYIRAIARILIAPE